MSFWDRIERSFYNMMFSKTGDRRLDQFLGLIIGALAIAFAALAVTEGSRLTGVWIPPWDTPYNKGDTPPAVELLLFALVAVFLAIRSYNYLKPDHDG